MNYETRIVAEMIEQAMSRHSYPVSQEAINDAAVQIVDYYSDVFDSMVDQDADY